MAAPTRVYSSRVRANITAEQAAALRRERTLTGRSTSEITRLALDAWLRKPTKKSRAS